MDYKDKLRLAKEALDSGSYDKETIEYIFPELKESEDEKIRKELIDFVQKFIECHDKPDAQRDEQYESWLAWLEKQNQNLEKLKFEKGKWYFCIEDYHPRADCTDFYQGEKYRCEKDGVMGVWRIKNPEKYFRECKTPTYAGRDAVRIQSIIQVLEYARSLDNYNQYGKADIDKNIAWLEKQGEQNLADGTFVNVDDVREDFVQEVYRVLDADSTNDMANQIIDAFDNLPTVTIKQDPCEHCEMTKLNCYSFPCDEKREFEQGEQKPQGKSALESIKEEKVDNANKLTEFEKAVKQVMEEAIECGDTRNLKADADMLLSLVHKPAWSEEDEWCLENAIMYCEWARDKAPDVPCCETSENTIKWLKSLKNRVQPQNKSALEANNELFLHVPAIEDTDKVLYDMICEYFDDGRPMDEDEINAFKKWLLSKVKKQ